jgi:hypothetical protein
MLRFVPSAKAFVVSLSDRDTDAVANAPALVLIRAISISPLECGR